MLWKSADKKLEELGFVKVYECSYEARYERVYNDYGFIHVLHIAHAPKIGCTIQSYEKGLNASGLNNSLSITLYETILAVMKAKEMGFKPVRRFA